MGGGGKVEGGKMVGGGNVDLGWCNKLGRLRVVNLMVGKKIEVGRWRAGILE